ncbi:hypothetical protein Ddc_14730 [Ditylenchus destructor]|nr:hypothetical protein Ddc_14730 [Ditylenchus destructor]
MKCPVCNRPSSSRNGVGMSMQDPRIQYLKRLTYLLHPATDTTVGRTVYVHYIHFDLQDLKHHKTNGTTIGVRDGAPICRNFPENQFSLCKKSPSPQPTGPPQLTIKMFLQNMPVDELKEMSVDKLKEVVSKTPPPTLSRQDVEQDSKTELSEDELDDTPTSSSKAYLPSKCGSGSDDSSVICFYKNPLTSELCCAKIANKGKKLLTHANSHLKYAICTCRVCGQGFHTFDKFEAFDHMRTKHEGEDAFKQLIYNEVESTQNILSRISECFLPHTIAEVFPELNDNDESLGLDMAGPGTSQELNPYSALLPIVNSVRTTPLNSKLTLPSAMTTFTPTESSNRKCMLHSSGEPVEFVIHSRKSFSKSKGIAVTLLPENDSLCYTWSRMGRVDKRKDGTEVWTYVCVTCRSLFEKDRLQEERELASQNMPIRKFIKFPDERCEWVDRVYCDAHFHGCKPQDYNRIKASDIQNQLRNEIVKDELECSSSVGPIRASTRVTQDHARDILGKLNSLRSNVSSTKQPTIRFKRALPYPSPPATTSEPEPTSTSYQYSPTMDINDKKHVLIQIKERWAEINADFDNKSMNRILRENAWKAIYEECKSRGHKWTAENDWKWLSGTKWPAWKHELNKKLLRYKKAGSDIRFNEFDLLIQDITGKDFPDIQTPNVPSSMSGDSDEKNFAHIPSQPSFENGTRKTIKRRLHFQTPETSKSSVAAICDQRSRLLELEIRLKERKLYKIDLEIYEMEQRMGLPHRYIENS